jgi:hypothetical protein
MDGRITLRAALAACAVVSYASIAAASPHHHPPVSAMLTCHQDILDASSALTGDVEGHLGLCLTRGLDCLLSSSNPSSCCERIAFKCDNDVAKIHASEEEFERVVASRACTRVPFPDLLAADGLNLGTLTARCACLNPPVATTSLQDLATCLRRVVEDDAISSLALLRAPRTHEALACLGLDDDFPAATEDQPSLCGTCPATTPTATASATPSPGAAGSPTATAAPTVAGTADTTPSPTPTVASTAESTPIGVPSATATAAPTTAQPTGSPTAAPTAIATSVPTATTTPLGVATPTSAPATPTLAPVPSPTPTAVCGNGIVEGDEECDGTAIDNSSCLEDICTCDDFCDNPGGTLSCNPDCTLNFSACTGGNCSF